MKTKWRKLSSKLIYKNRWFSLYLDNVRRPDGSVGEYHRLQKDPGVVVVAFDGKRIYLVNQYRHNFGRKMWELPAGKSESKNYLHEAKKELKEETGLTARKWTFLGNFACGPGHTDHIGKVYLAESLEQGDADREPSEQDMVVKKFTMAEIERMIARGEIIDSWATAPLYLFRLVMLHKKS